MYSIWKLCTSKIKKKKIQNALIALIILLSTLLLSTAIVVIKNTSNLYLDIHSKLSGSHEILELKNGILDPNKINTWWKTQKGVIASDIMTFRNLTGITFNGKDVSNVELYMVDTPSNPRLVDKLLFAKGKEQNIPDKGTIWIPTSLAYKNNILIDDEIEFKTDNKKFNLKVSGIVVDLPYCAPFTTSARIWMNENDFKQYVQDTQGNDYYMMSLRFDNYTKSRTYWEKFEGFLGTPYLESVRNFESLSSFYMIINKIIGFIMIFLAIVMMLIAIFSIGFTISDDIISSYKTIGIIKSLGMSSFKTICVNVLQYTLLACFSVMAGIVLSFFLSGLIINSSLSFLKTENSAINLHFNSIAITVFFLIMITIITFAFIFSYKTRRIQPVQAIRYGTSEKNNVKLASRINYSGKKLASFELLPATLVIGLRAILKKVRSAIFITIISALMTSVLVFGFTFINSIISIKQTIAMWGYDSSDITVRVENNLKMSFEDFNKDLLKDSRIKNYNIYSDINGVIPAEKSMATGEVLSDSMAVLLSVVGGSYDNIGFTNIEGRNPVNGDEISIGVNVAKKFNKRIGDTLEVYIEGKKCRFIVTGIYQAIANMSYSGRICIDGIRKIDPFYDPKDIVFINLHDKISPKEFINDLNTKYGRTISASTQEELINEVFSQAVALLITPMLIIGVAFILIAFIIVFCNCHINIKKEINTYGIYKSLGMRSVKIRFSISSGVLVLELVGAFIGSLIGIWLLPILLNVILSNYGIIKMPLVINYKGIFAVAVIGVLTASLGSWLASKKIRKTSPRSLTIE